jgi:phosphopantetheine--protein transferase-like protein
MIKGVGIDIIKVSRFTRSFGPRFFARIFTESEQQYIKGKPLQTMAGMFAAKEAVAKALGTGFSGFWPCDIEICRDARGKPYVVLHNGAARFKGYAIEVSITHTETDAAAVAVAL